MKPIIGSKWHTNLAELRNADCRVAANQEDIILVAVADPGASTAISQSAWQRYVAEGKVRPFTEQAFTLIELLVVCAILAILAAIVLGTAGGCSRSDGERVGTLTKFSYKGMFKSTKSWEGEMVLGGVRQTANNGVTANTWDFSVLDGAVVKKVQAILNSGHRAKLSYHQTFTRNPFARDTTYIVTDAADLEATNAPTKAEQ